MNDVSSKRSSTLRSWAWPLAFVALGGYAWACVDDPDLSGSESTGGEPGSEGSTATATPTTTETPTSTTNDESSGTTMSPGTGEPSEDVTRRDVLESVAERVIIPSIAEFTELATELTTAVDAYAVAVAKDPVAAGAQLSVAQDAWRAAMAKWQQLEVMQVGPAGAAGLRPGGEGIRDKIYSWPTVDRCAVDRQIADEGYADENFFIDELVNTYGLAALEYLLFVHDMNHTCPAQVQLDGPWAALGFEEIERRRGAYAARISAELVVQGELLGTRWSPDGDDFTAKLLEYGGDSPYKSEMAAIDEVFRGMYYIDKQTTDAKLGTPIGLQVGCAEPPCVDLLESPWSGVAASNIAENLRGFKRMLWGGVDANSGNGFDDLLIAAGHPEIATELFAVVDTAIDQAEALDGSLQMAVVNDPAAVEALYTSLRDMVTIIKGPFVMTLMLTIPAEGAGDTD
jgi:predicted lipoprotein